MSNPERQLLIHTNGGAEAAEHLLDWLRDEDRLRGRVALPPTPIREGEMGGAIGEIVTVTLGSGVTMTALARSLTTWLTHRRSEITVTVIHPSGNTVEFTGKRVSANDVLDQLQALVEPVDDQR
ncbi:effector-associated constant component EACC1 [Nocardia nova]|uniref:effector-associated constant component EACC1 n=1 Tax=Nocardia nova TaxID=37330 RepID=UPI001E4FF80A|nr:hypothetical protein [Nocardia nova]